MMMSERMSDEDFELDFAYLMNMGGTRKMLAEARRARESEARFGDDVDTLAEQIVALEAQRDAAIARAEKAERTVKLISEPCHLCGGTVGPGPGEPKPSLMCYGCAPPEADRPVLGGQYGEYLEFLKARAEKADAALAQVARLREALESARCALASPTFPPLNASETLGLVCAALAATAPEGEVDRGALAAMRREGEELRQEIAKRVAPMKRGPWKPEGK